MTRRGPEPSHSPRPNTVHQRREAWGSGWHGGLRRSHRRAPEPPAGRFAAAVPTLGGVNWLVTSIVLSVVLTVALNAGLRAFPRAGQRLDERLTRAADEHPNGGVIVPWKAMIVGSLVLTIGLNLLLWATR